MSIVLTDKIAEARAEKTRLGTEREAKRKTASEAVTKVAGMDGDVRGTAEFQAAKDAAAAFDAIQTQYEAAADHERDLLAMAGDRGSEPAPERDDRPAGDPTDPRQSASWKIGDAIQAHSTHLERLSSSTGRFGRFDAGQIASRDALAASLGTVNVGGLIRPDYRGLDVAPHRDLTILDLVSKGTTNSNSIEYTQTTGIARGVVAPVAEGALKPELGLTFTDADAPIRTLAGWIKANKQVLADAPLLRTFIETEIRGAVNEEAEDQILAGTGTGQDIRGLLNINLVLSAGAAAGENVADALSHGITAVTMRRQRANAIAMHPYDAEKYRLLRDGSGGTANSGAYMNGGPAGFGPLTAWGRPIVESEAMTEGIALVGNFAKALFVIREGVQLLFSDSDQDDFIRNKVTILGEMRGGLVVPRPDAFCKVELPDEVV
jgi:HK97 family phage major capsid protein